ncbi:MAG: ABC transporter ATP-binding protein [Desulfobacteraceae bacterium]|nr:ABC transporter ATP-binding protein [Desulfobacteraceae bacterium]
MLEINAVNVFYGNVQALWEVSLQIEEGEFVALVGSNGAGKTTLLKSIVGLLPIASGKIDFLGKEISKVPSYKISNEGICLVPEDRGLFPEMSVFEHLELGAYASKMLNSKDKNLEWVFSLFPVLGERSKQLAGTLSGGEQQTLAVGRALMANPKLLMLDEPSLGLAPKLVSAVFNTLDEISGQGGITILLVEQNVAYALARANRAYVLENGRIVLQGKAEELRENEQVKIAYLGI